MKNWVNLKLIYNNHVFIRFIKFNYNFIKNFNKIRYY